MRLQFEAKLLGHAGCPRTGAGGGVVKPFDELCKNVTRCAQRIVARLLALIGQRYVCLRLRIASIQSTDAANTFAASLIVPMRGTLNGAKHAATHSALRLSPLKISQWNARLQCSY